MPINAANAESSNQTVAGSGTGAVVETTKPGCAAGHSVQKVGQGLPGPYEPTVETPRKNQDAALVSAGL